MVVQAILPEPLLEPGHGVGLAEDGDVVLAPWGFSADALVQIERELLGDEAFEESYLRAGETEHAPHGRLIKQGGLAHDSSVIDLRVSSMCLMVRRCPSSWSASLRCSTIPRAREA